MKRLREYGLMILASLILLCGTSSIQAQNDETNVKKTLNELIGVSRTKSFEKAARLIAYDGEDVQRVRKDSFNPANKDELNQVKRICKKISALIDLSSKQEDGKFEIKKEGQIEYFIAEINFISGDQKLTTAFSFVKTQKGFLLTEIN